LASPLSQAVDLLRCPACKDGGVISRSDQEIRCAACGAGFPISAGRVDFLRSSGRSGDALNARPRVSGGLRLRIKSMVPSASTNLSQSRILQMLARRLAQRASPVVLVVGCGRQANAIRCHFPIDKGGRLILTDVSPDTDAEWLCDAHDLPLRDGSVDAVITTAVLEHVLRPQEAVAEIYRVVKTGGLVYSEIPFMQQVHEGAHDFTRYSMTGHRMLFRQFREVEAGLVAGPGTSLTWSLEYFAMAFFRSAVMREFARLLTRILFFWLKYFDYWLARRPFAQDGASCTFFYGEKIGAGTDVATVLGKYGS
jgi:ubiquinone/menaquinone biosynthesis C-methylase UbiE